MFKSMKLQFKLVLIGCLLVVVPQIIVGSITFFQNRSTLKFTVDVTKNQAFAHLDQLVKSVYGLVESHQEVNERNIKSALNVAREIVSYGGGFSLDEKTIRWQATNQFSLATSVLELPRMKIGNSWLGQVNDPKISVPVVDKVKDTVSVTCTIFQRMNAAGDMLRVATNVLKDDGTRAIGTFIPSTNPDGKPNPVTTAIMKGESFTGRAYVVNNWYISSYEPLQDAAGKIIGMLYVGIPVESVKSLRETIMQIVVGKTGYAWVLDSKGKYVISNKGKRDGEDISTMKDDQGHLFIQEMVKKGLALKPGEIGEHYYPWKNPGEAVPRIKVARFMYFAPWDWIIGVGSAQDEFLDSAAKIESSSMQSSIILFSVFILSLVAAVLIWIIVAKRITQPIIALTEAAEKMSKGDLSINIDIDSADEIGALAKAIGRMQTSLKMAMERLLKQR
ncbi:MAG: Cache 3/Cache 2 fusion domain-containing protein [Pseudomonadota bacterium]